MEKVDEEDGGPNHLRRPESTKEGRGRQSKVNERDGWREEVGKGRRMTGDWRLTFPVRMSIAAMNRS